MKTLLTFLRQSWLMGALLAGLCGTARAMFINVPELIPVDRLIKSAKAYLARHPDKALAHYALARIHYLAFHMKCDKVPAFGLRDKEDLPPIVAPKSVLGKGGKDLFSHEILYHAVQALRGFNEADRLLPKDDEHHLSKLTYLGVASLMEECANWKKTVKFAKLPPELNEITLARVRKAYAKALTFAVEEESKIPQKPYEGLSILISYEAAKALVRLAKVEGEALTDDERNDVERAEKALAHFEALKKYNGPITPMVFSFHPAAHLDALLAPETVVDFDLRGYGPRECWPWVKPELGLLVWDPERTGDIRSARQLFGGYTFQIFRANGYDALAALDDDGDGTLSGAELDGISVWFDRNSDGISTPDEVTPLRDLGIVSVAVTMDGRDGIHPTNARGVTLRDGRTLRTWDWMAEPVRRMDRRVAKK